MIGERGAWNSVTRNFRKGKDIREFREDISETKMMRESIAGNIIHKVKLV